MEMNKKALSAFRFSHMRLAIAYYWLHGLLLVNILIFAGWNEMEYACNKRVRASIFRYAHIVYL